VEPTAAFAQLQLSFVDQIQGRYEVIRPLVLFADRTATQRAQETATHPDTVRTLQRRFQRQGMLGLVPTTLNVTPRGRAPRVPDAVRTYHQIQTFRRMIRERRGHEFDAWIAEVQQTGVKELRAFVKGLLTDEAAVRAGLSLVWSNGPTEGFIHQLKRIKRQASGRAGVDFLRHRILVSSPGKAA
jgi:hypothetical protein